MVKIERHRGKRKNERLSAVIADPATADPSHGPILLLFFPSSLIFASSVSSHHPTILSLSLSHTQGERVLCVCVDRHAHTHLHTRRGANDRNENGCAAASMATTGWQKRIRNRIQCHHYSWLRFESITSCQSDPSVRPPFPPSPGAAAGRPRHRNQPARSFLSFSLSLYTPFLLLCTAALVLDVQYTKRERKREKKNPPTHPSSIKPCWPTHAHFGRCAHMMYYNSYYYFSFF